MADYSQVQRQFQILRILNENSKGVNVTTLHNHLSAWGYNVTGRTIRRDIDSLSLSFLIYENSQTRPSTFILQKAGLENTSMSFNELQAIKFIQELIRLYQHLDVGINAGILLQKLLDSLPPNQGKWLRQASPLLKVNLNILVDEQDHNSNIKEIIQEAITKHLCIKVKYYSFHNNTICLRTIEPHLLEINEGCYHLWAYCHERHEFRDFRVSRFLSTEATPDSFKRKDELLKKCLANRFKNMSGQEAQIVKLRFSGTAARIIKEYYIKQADKLELCDDGTVLFKKSVAITPVFKQWILGFGHEVEALEPASLRETIRKEAIKMLYVYEK